MARRVALVYSAAHRRGGVERIVHDLLSKGRPDDRLSFVGGEFTPGISGVDHVACRLSPGTNPVALLNNRRVLGRAMQSQSRLHAVLVTAGANCPPGDVVLVQSVHRAWLALDHNITIRGRSVSGRVRRLHPWHAMMLELERRYFTSGDYRYAIACSTRVAQDLTELYGVDPARIRVVPNGFAAEQFNWSQRERLRVRMRTQLGWNEGSTVLLLAANELHRKGLSTILRAMATLKEPSLRLAVVGRAPGAPFRPLIESLRLTDQVTFYGPTDRIEEYYAAADSLVLPTSYEPFGLVIVEALATGLPVITTRRAGASDAVIPSETGLLMDDPDDPDELANALAIGMSSGTFARWSAQSLGSVDQFSWDRVATRIWTTVDDASEKQ